MDGSGGGPARRLVARFQSQGIIPLAPVAEVARMVAESNGLGRSAPVAPPTVALVECDRG